MDERLHHQSYLFTVRLWREDLGEGKSEWRGKVQRVLDGEAYYFREWSELIERLKALIEGCPQPPSVG